MVLIGRRLTPDELRMVLDDPAVVSALLYGDLDDEDAEMPDPESNRRPSTRWPPHSTPWMSKRCAPGSTRL